MTHEEYINMSKEEKKKLLEQVVHEANSDQKAIVTIAAIDIVIKYLKKEYIPSASSSTGGCKERYFGCHECYAIRMCDDLKALKASVE